MQGRSAKGQEGEKPRGANCGDKTRKRGLRREKEEKKRDLAKPPPLDCGFVSRRHRGHGRFGGEKKNG